MPLPAVSLQPRFKVTLRRPEMKFKTLKILAATAVLAGSMQTVTANVKTFEKFTTVT